jgi:hypothetical protein
MVAGSHSDPAAGAIVAIAMFGPNPRTLTNLAVEAFWSALPRMIQFGQRRAPAGLHRQLGQIS